jgi:hypothetical protein
VATLNFNKTSLFPNLKDGKNITHTCLMARGGKRKVKTILCSSPNTSLKCENIALQDELVCLNKSLELQFDTLLSNASTSQHDPSVNPSIAQSCLRCKDIDVDACATNVKLIESLKVKITSLEGEAQQKKKDLEEKKLKYARGAYLNSRRPNIKDGIGFQRFEKHNARVKINGH